MTDFTPTPEQIDRVEQILEDWFGHEEPTSRSDATDFLKDIGPLIYEQGRRDALNEAADKLRSAAAKAPRPMLDSGAYDYWRGYRTAAIEGANAFDELRARAVGE